MAEISNRQKEAIGIRVVQQVIRELWDCGWQEFEARNDNAIDGFIIMRRRSIETGGIVFAQVKCGGNGYRQDQAQYPDKIGVQLGKAYIDSHRPRWKATLGPAVIIFVDDTINSRNPPAWWADLKNEDTYSPTNAGMLLVPKSQKFGSHTKGEFHSLCGSRPIHKILPIIDIKTEDLIVPNTKDTLLLTARSFYKKWSTEDYPFETPALGSVLINRVGWRHITRQNRLKERVFQSLTLLGVAKRMLQELQEFDLLGRPQIKKTGEGNMKIIDHLGLRANITFPHRHESVVQIVLKRERVVEMDSQPILQRIWFLSVYELRRGVIQS